jgi:hypothetical protein
MLNIKFGDRPASSAAVIAAFSGTTIFGEISLEVDGELVAERRGMKAFNGFEYLRSDGSRLRVQWDPWAFFRNRLRVIVDGYQAPLLSRWREKVKGMAPPRVGLLALAFVFFMMAVANPEVRSSQVTLIGSFVCAGLCLLGALFFRRLRGRGCDFGLLFALLAYGLVAFAVLKKDPDELFIGLFLAPALLVYPSSTLCLLRRNQEKAIYALRRDGRILALPALEMNRNRPAPAVTAQEDGADTGIAIPPLAEPVTTPKENQCLQCGYEMQDEDDRCPKCGWSYVQ